MTASYKKRLAMVFAVMVLLALAAAAITALTGGFNKNSARLNIVASFLPVYGAALQVTDGVMGRGKPCPPRPDVCTTTR